MVFLVFVAVVIISLVTFSKLNGATRMVVHTQDVLLTLENVLQAAVDGETGQRGYIVTGDEAFLQPYTEATQRINGDLQRLQTLVADNPAQSARLPELRRIVTDRFAHLKQVSALRQSQGFQAAVAEIQTQRGKQMMDQLRKIVAEMKAEEQRLLAVREANARQTTNNAKHALQALAFLTFCLLVLGYLVLTRQREQLINSELISASLNTQLQSILDAATQVAIIATRPDGTISLFNRGAEKMLGWKAEELVGKQTPAVLHIEQEVSTHAHELTERLGKAVTGFDTFVALARDQIMEEREWTYVRKDGTRLTGALAVTPVMDANKQLTGYLGIIKDVTERRKADEELRRLNRELAAARDQALEASRLKSAFLANMSHELRTPLNGIIGFSEILIQEPMERLKDHLKPSLEKIHRSGKHLLALINDILDLSKIEAGKMTLTYDNVDVCSLIADVSNQLREQIAKNRNTFDVNCANDAGFMYIDPTRLKQVLYNLLSNAGKFTENGKIDLQVSRGGEAGAETLTFAVRDTGIGMSREQISRLFRDFMQADSSTTRKYGGTGLGLAISKRFCQMMGGDIKVESEQGKGSTFTAVLPVYGAGAAPQSQMHSSSRMQAVTSPIAAATVASKHASRESATVLAIDDDPDVLEIVSAHLHRDGLNVYTTTSGEEGLRLAREIRPDVITLDVMMPNLDGWTVLNQLKLDPATSDIPVVMVTMLQDKEMGYTLGASDYLVKPVDSDRLLSVVRRYRRPDRSYGSVLVVEDDPTSRELLKHLLTRDKWAVLEAPDGQTGLELLASQTPDLILLDLMMPGMDGFQFVEEMRTHAEWNEVPIVIVTSKEITQQDRDRLNGRVERILQKGIHTRDEILAEVKKSAGQRKKNGEQQPSTGSAPA